MRLSILILLLISTLAAQEAPELSLKARIALPNVDGRMDHFGADVRGERLFVSALGNHTAEVLDLKAGRRLKAIPNLEEPQGQWKVIVEDQHKKNGVIIAEHELADRPG